MAETSEDFSIAEAFGAVIDYVDASVGAPLNRFPGCFEARIDAHWHIALNGHATPSTCSRGVEVEPFHCYVEFNGWPAGDLTPFGGIIAAGGVANEDAFIAALRMATEDLLEVAAAVEDVNEAAAEERRERGEG